MKSKKAISDVIVSVLMILLVIAAVTILGAVLFNFISDRTTTFGPKSDCMLVQLKILDAKYEGGGFSNVSVQYVSGPKALDSIVIYN